MQSRYSVITPSTEVQDTDDQFWPDPLTFPINRLRLTDNAYKFDISQRDKIRIDSLMFRLYAVAEFDDIVLWSNNIQYLSEATLGKEIHFPTKSTLNRFLIENRVNIEEF